MSVVLPVHSILVFDSIRKVSLTDLDGLPSQCFKGQLLLSQYPRLASSWHMRQADACLCELPTVHTCCTWSRRNLGCLPRNFLKKACLDLSRSCTQSLNHLLDGCQLQL